MAIVNNILNMVDLNTKKYSEKLKKMKKDTARDTKSMSEGFKGIGSAVKALAATVVSVSFANSIKKELMETEKSVAGLIGAFGGLKAARDQFEMLQQAARDTIQPFDQLRAVAMNLKRNGIQATAEQMKTFSQIAYGTGQSLETVGNAFTSALQGRVKSLNQLGIVAKDNGDKLILTYKGVTTTVEKSAEGLGKYFETLGKENKGALEYLQGGMTGAINHLENAWGDFVRGIAESGLGQAIADTIRVGANALDGFTRWINNNQQSIQKFFNRWSDYIKTLGDDFESLQRDMESWFNTANKVNGTKENDAGVLGWVRSLGQTAGDKWFELFNGSNTERAYKAEKERAKTLFDARTQGLKKGTEQYEKEVEKLNQQIVSIERKYSNEQTTVFGRIGQFFNLQDTANKFQKSLDSYEDYLSQQDKLREEHQKNAEKDEQLPAPLNFSEYKSSVGAVTKQAEDRWADYFDKIKDMARGGWSDIEKLQYDYEKKLAELDEQFASSRLATESEYLQAKDIINQDFIRSYEELQKQARDFAKGLVGDELTDLQDSYREKLELLEKHHEDSLISEELYLQARQSLYNEYTTELTKQTQKKRGKNSFFSDQDLENIQSLTDGLDSMTDAFSNLTQGMSESSATYRALFAIQKSFAVASATMNAIVAWSQALSDSTQVSWIAKLAQYANAVAMTTNIIGQLKSVTMHDKGGYIPAGGLGIVGEYGPELVRGPANVTSRRETADLARSALTGSSKVTVNLIEDQSRAGQVDSRERDGDEVINIFVSNIRKGGQMAKTLESTYALRRYGA